MESYHDKIFISPELSVKIINESMMSSSQYKEEMKMSIEYAIGWLQRNVLLPHPRSGYYVRKRLRDGPLEPNKKTNTYFMNSCNYWIGNLEKIRKQEQHLLNGAPLPKQGEIYQYSSSSPKASPSELQYSIDDIDLSQIIVKTPSYSINADPILISRLENKYEGHPFVNVKTQKGDVMISLCEVSEKLGIKI